MTTFYVIKKSYRTVKPYTRTRKGRIEHVGGYSAEMTEAERKKIEAERERAREGMRKYRERLKGIKEKIDDVVVEKKGVERELEEAKAMTKAVVPPAMSTRDYYERIFDIKKEYIATGDDGKCVSALVSLGMSAKDIGDLMVKYAEERLDHVESLKPDIKISSKGEAALKKILEPEPKKVEPEVPGIFLPDWLTSKIKDFPKGWRIEDVSGRKEPTDYKYKVITPEGGFWSRAKTVEEAVESAIHGVVSRTETKRLEEETLALDKKKKELEAKAKKEADDLAFIRMKKKAELGEEKDIKVSSGIGTVKGYEVVLPEKAPDISMGKVWIWKNEKTGFWDVRDAGTKEWIIRSADEVTSPEEALKQAISKYEKKSLEELRRAKEEEERRRREALSAEEKRKLREAEEEKATAELKKLGIKKGERFIDRDTGEYCVAMEVSRGELRMAYGRGGLDYIPVATFAARFERYPNPDVVPLDGTKKFGGLVKGEMLYSSKGNWGAVVESTPDTISVLWCNHGSVAMAVERISVKDWEEHHSKSWKEKKAGEAPLKPATLTADQKKGLAAEGAKNEITAESIQMLARRHGVTTEAVNKALAEIRALPLKINRKFRMNEDSFPNVFATGILKNQFQLHEKATSSGSLDPHKEGGRDSWERAAFGGHLHKDPEYEKTRSGHWLPDAVADKRPIYGHWDLHKGRADGYGEIQLVLKDECKSRGGYTIGNSSGVGRTDSESKGTFENCLSLLNHYLGWKKSGGSGGWDYIEAQVLGGIDLRRDVKQIVINRRAAADSHHEHIKALAKKFGIPLKEVSSAEEA